MGIDVLVSSKHLIHLSYTKGLFIIYSADNLFLGSDLKLY